MPGTASATRLAVLSLLGILAAGLPPSTGAAPAVSAGNRHVLALAADGTVRAWGEDSSGQLGLGRTLEISRPAAVPGISGVMKVCSGANHVVALRNDGTVWAWGRNVNGELGDGTTTSRPAPAPVSGLTGVVDIAAGESHTLALKSDGSVWSWGVNWMGQLGYEEYTLTPLKVPGIPAIRKIAAGMSHNLALAQDGSLWAWGGGDYGQLGDGTRTELYSGRAKPGTVAGIADVAAIAAGGAFSVAVRRDGTVWAWGRNEEGGLGIGGTNHPLLPTRVPGVSGAVEASAGIDHTLALLGDGTVLAWGGGYPGQLGNSRFEPSTVPVPAAGLSGVTAIAAGYFYSFARTADGAVWAWGYNANGQLGDGTTENRGTPTRLAGITAGSVAAGGFHGFAVTAEGQVFAWGANDYGELGAGGGVVQSTPSTVPGVSDVTAIAAGGLHSLALRRDGTVLAWGANGSGQLGDETSKSRSTAAPVPGLSGVRAIAAGYYHSMALRDDGTVWMWGYGYEGQMGNGTNDGQGKPAPVPGLSRIVAIATGPSHAFALASDGTLWAWGSNSAGQLGDGTHGDRYSPVRVSGSTGLNGVKSISAGDEHSLALAGDGTVWSWGRNTEGQLGIGTGENRSFPGIVPGLRDIAAISAGSSFSHAVARDGTLWTWGTNWSGQLGDGSGDDHPLPVPVPGMDRVAAVSGGGANGVALKSDATAWAWGDNTEGRVGDGTFIERPSPVIVLREGGVGSVATNDWFLDLDPAIPKTIPADKVPVFLVVAQSAQGEVSAQLHYRPEDIGSTASTYVFALAPANLVKSSPDGTAPLKLGKAKSRRGGKSTSVDCVLAQLSAAGVLQAVSPDQLRAAVSGVLGAIGQAVPVVSAGSSLAASGATFFVGYGSSGSAMLGSGLNRGVLTVPGASECKPRPPQTGWWWNPAEDGRGFSLEARGRNLFFAAFLYDDSGRSAWYVSTGPVSLEGAYYAGDLLRASGGQTLGGPYPGFPALATVGRITLSFLNESTGLMVWPGGTVPLQRFNIVPNGLNLAPVAGQPESGWWWNEQEAGRGFFLEWQGGNLDIAGYMYDEAGNPVWYITVGPIAGSPEARAFSGSWWSFGGGQTLTGPWKPNARLSDNVAPVTIQFSRPDTAIMTLPNGRTTNLKRHRF